MPWVCKDNKQRTWREIYKILKTAYEGFEIKDMTFREWRKEWLYEKRHGAFRPTDVMLADIELEKAKQRTDTIRTEKIRREIVQTKIQS